MSSFPLPALLSLCCHGVPPSIQVFLPDSSLSSATLFWAFSPPSTLFFPSLSSAPSRDLHSIVIKLLSTFTLLDPFLTLTAKVSAFPKELSSLLSSRKDATQFLIPPTHGHRKCCWHFPYTSVLLSNLHSSTLLQNPLPLWSSYRPLFKQQLTHTEGYP